MKSKVFLDTSFAVAMAVEKDANHERAIQLSETLANFTIITTQAVVLEIGNAFSRRKLRPYAVEIISRLGSEPNISVISLSNPLIEAAFELFSSRMDKEWGLVDCVSFVVMRERRIEAALTADQHFVQAGFRALLREETV